MLRGLPLACWKYRTKFPRCRVCHKRNRRDTPAGGSFRFLPVAIDSPRFDSMSAQLSLKKKLIFAAIPLLVFGGIALVGFVAISSRSLFAFAHRSGQYQDADEISQQYFQFDENLGSRLVPDQTTPIKRSNGEVYTIHADEDGLRKAQAGETLQEAPLILTLGCSFSFGAGVNGDETFSHLVAERLGGTSLNAAIPGHGLSQMVLQARELVPSRKPDLVLIQYSYWLVDRSTRIVIPSMFGKVPGPYFSEEGDSFTIIAPRFRSSVFDVPLRKYGQSERGPLSFAGFVCQVGFPIYGFDGFRYGSAMIATKTGLQPGPTSRKREAESWAYGEILELCRAHEAGAYVVGLGSSTKPVPSMDHLGFPETRLIDSNGYLVRKLSSDDQDHYAQAYYHWAGEPDRIIDTHPNAYAHSVIAESIIRVLESDDSDSR